MSSADDSQGPNPSVQVFIAEEDDVLRAEIASALRADGFDLIECVDGATLFQRLMERVAHPGARRSIIITQARLPVFGALRILHSVRLLDVPIPVILMTNIPRREIEDAADEAGAAAVLQKPIQIDELRRAVARIAKEHGLT